MPDESLVDQITAGLAETGVAAARRWADLEQSWSHDVLVEAASAVMSRPVWDLTDIGPVGMVTGSGGMVVRLPNVSTLAALVASCMPGITVVKPGSLASRSRVAGPAGLAVRLGLATPKNAGQLRRMLERDRFAILPTEELYPWLNQPETFTVPLLCEAVETASFQPCTAHWKVNGVVDPTPAVHRARAHQSSGQRILVVHGTTDVAGWVIDDVSIAGPTCFLDGEGRHWSVPPEEFGTRRVSARELVVPQDLAPEQVFESVLSGTAPRAWIELVAASAAAVLLHAEVVSDLAEGFAAAREVIRSGVAAAKLRRLQELFSD
ncbi:MAG TPA: hypothetical protein VF444_02980 [Pseudonocardiaceae bacterium]